MKNLFIALALSFAIGAGAQTQKTVTQKTTTTKKEVTAVKLTPAQQNVADLAAFTPLDAKTKTNAENLFEGKYKMLAENPNLSEMRKSVLSQNFSHQLEKVLGQETFARVKSNKELYESLIN